MIRIEKDPNRYRWIHPHTTFDYLNPKEDKLYDLLIRIVRFEIADSVYETLYTNLPREDFSVDVLKKLYRLRWGIETAFIELKYNVGLASLHIEFCRSFLICALDRWHYVICFCDIQKRKMSNITKIHLTFSSFFVI